MNPGHAIECGWFLLVEAERTGNAELRRLAVDSFIRSPFEYGWDKENGGLYSFLDIDGTMLEFVRMKDLKKKSLNGQCCAKSTLK